MAAARAGVAARLTVRSTAIRRGARIIPSADLDLPDIRPLQEVRPGKGSGVPYFDLAPQRERVVIAGNANRLARLQLLQNRKNRRMPDGGGNLANVYGFRKQEFHSELEHLRKW